MGSYKKLIQNSFLFAIGNLGSKLILLMLVPLYTYYLTPSEYGIIDIVMITSNLLLPIISLSVYDSVLRFVMEKNMQTEAVFTNAVVVTIFGSLIVIILFPVINTYNIFGEMQSYMFAILIIQSFQTILAQFTKAIGEIKVYSINGILMTLVLGGLNILLLVKLNIGISGYFISIISANIFSVIFLSFSTNIFSYLKFNEFNSKLIKTMLKYSIPLIPNALMWWIMNASSRYFIFYFVGASATGLFAVANKIPSILSILSSIFTQAWQLSAIEEYNSKDRSKFYSEVFNKYSMLMFLGASVVIVFLKYTMKYAVSEEYYSSWKFVPFLLLSVVFSSFATFLGTNYIAAKKTGGVFRTTIIGGIINIILNFSLIPFIGALGAGISIMISMMVVWILRVYDTRKYIVLNLDMKNILINLLIIFLQCSILFLNMDLRFELLIQISLFILMIISNKNFFMSVRNVYYQKRIKDRA